MDFVKIYDSKISRETYLETLVQAQSRGMKTSGHMPFTVNLTEGVERGLDALEHMFNILKACSAKEDSLTKFLQERVRTGKPIGFYAALPLFYESYDENKAKELFRYLARNNFSVVPTLFVVKTSIVELKNNDHATDSFLSYIDPKIQATYQGRLKSAKAQTDETNEFLKRFMLKSNAMVPQMYAAGVNILAGSDCGASNSFVYPGVSLHEELKLMVASGLTPAQALQTATRNAAKFMGAEHIHGSIQEGRSSDIVVLDANPLSDINAIGKINMVISGGSLYSQSDLEKLLKSVKQ